MIRYHFDGVNIEGQKVGGFLFAENEVSAREKLKGNGYAVLMLTPYVEDAKAEAHLTSFQFRGQKTDDTFVQGKIQANDVYGAYKKLRAEYKLKLEYLVPNGLSPLETQQLKDRGIDSEMVELFNEEFEVGKKKKVSKENPDENKAAMLTEKRQQKMDFYRESIELVIQDVTQILVGLEGHISYEQYRALKDQLDNLARLRASNSIDHLDHLVRRLFDKLRTLEEIETLDSHTKSLLVKSVGGLSEKFIKGSSQGPELDLSFIDTKQIKKTIRSLNVLENILQTLYAMFVVLAGLCLLTYIVLLGKSILTGMDHFFFFAKSDLFLFMTSFSCLVVGIYFPALYRSEGWDRRQKILYGVITSLLWMVYAVEFPVIFFWT